jgi:hypothetical protein
MRTYLIVGGLVALYYVASAASVIGELAARVGGY